MNFDLSPTCAAVICERIDQIRVVLLAGKQVSMTEDPAVGVGPITHSLWIFRTPALDPPLLLGVRGISRLRLWNDRRLKVVSHTNDEMNGARIKLGSSDLLPDIG